MSANADPIFARLQDLRDVSGTPAVGKSPVVTAVGASGATFGFDTFVTQTELTLALADLPTIDTSNFAKLDQTNAFTNEVDFADGGFWDGNGITVDIINGEDFRVLNLPSTVNFADGGSWGGDGIEIASTINNDSQNALHFIDGSSWGANGLNLGGDLQVPGAANFADGGYWNFEGLNVTGINDDTGNDLNLHCDLYVTGTANFGGQTNVTDNFNINNEYWGDAVNDFLTDLYASLQNDNHYVTKQYFADGGYWGGDGINLSSINLNTSSELDLYGNLRMQYATLYFSDGSNWDGGGIRHSSTSYLGLFGKSPVGQQTGGAATAGTSWTSNEQLMLNRLWTASRNYGLLS